MAIHEKKVPLYECDKCNKMWLPREIDKAPKQCPYCGTRHWNKSEEEKGDDVTKAA